MFSIHNLPHALPGEKVIMILRRDAFILFKKVIFFIILVLLPLPFFIILSSFYATIFTGAISYPAIVLLTSAYFLFCWLFFFFSFIDYYLDTWIITNKRIVDVRQDGFFSRKIAEQKLSRVQDVSSAIKGFFPTILKYGDVHVQTAAAEQMFLFNEIPNPDGVRALIAKLAHSARHPKDEE